MKPPNPFDTPDEVANVLRPLGHRHSRAVCHYFRFYSTEVASVDDLVQFISEHDERATDKHAVELRLNRAILPELANAGFIDYDPRRETVQPREPEPVDAWLDHVVEAGEVPL